MVNLTTQHAKQECVENRIRARKGDIHELLYKNESFDLIVAIGVIPWLHDLPKALMEIARTVCPNGYVVLTIDNAIRLTTLLDPLTFPVFIIIKNWGRHKLQRARTAALKTEESVPSYNQHSPIKFDAFLHKSGLIKIKSGSIGFGPFTFMSHPLFSEKVGIKINSMLQDYANSGNPVLRLTGSHYIILARKYVRD